MKLPKAPAKMPDLPSDSEKKKPEAPDKRGDWRDHVARTTAGLAVIAAITSAQNASEFSQTILVQAETSDKWAYYQSKSIKQHLRVEQLELLRAMSIASPEIGKGLQELEKKDEKEKEKYDRDLATARADAERSQADKARHEKQSTRYGYAFISLQAGVVVCTVAGTSSRRALWVLAIALGVIGLVLALDAFTLWI
jgi:hypothetical protein